MVRPIYEEFGMQVGDLQDWINEFVKKYGREGEVWIGNGNGLSNHCTDISRLNRNDMILDFEIEEQPNEPNP